MATTTTSRLGTTPDTEDRYYNKIGYPLMQGDTRPPWTIGFTRINGTPLDFSRHSNLVVRGYWRAKGSSTVVSTITLSAVNASIGQYRIDSWPAAATAGSVGDYELEIEFDYDGSGTGGVETSWSLIKGKLYSDFN